MTNQEKLSVSDGIGEPVPDFDSWQELWVYCFDGFCGLLPKETQDAFIAVSKGYTREIAKHDRYRFQIAQLDGVIDRTLQSN